MRSSFPAAIRLRLSYTVKSLLPKWLETHIRQTMAQRKRASVQDIWPILESAGTPPPGWTGWPEGRQFAFVISHDVDTKRGLERCLQIADVEERLGFRSAFYFVPKGRYEVPKALRDELVCRGFEVGVHGLYHDWRTFTSRRVFERRAPRINQYLKDWGAVGFRAPSMIRNLDWTRELDVEYDASTFDTDPFEPQPEGANTIFPFWVEGKGTRLGYVELPYTLPQDYTLFVLLQEKTTEVWKRKLAWIAQKGGMALMDVHPCYTDPLGTSRLCDSYPMNFYESFLRHVKKEYKDGYWQVLPKDLARFWRSKYSPKALVVQPLATPSTPISDRISLNGQGEVSGPRKKIWIDLDNTPHVPFFKPIMRELESRGYDIVVTSRDAFQVCELADHMGVRYKKIGRHSGKNKVLKVIGLFYRAMQLLPMVLREKPDLALSHGSRSQIIVANLLGMRSILIGDYEFSKALPLMHAQWVITPEVIPEENISHTKDRIRHYPGIKEDVYACDFKPDERLYADLGVSCDDILVTMRPPATEAHYHNPESEKLFSAAMDVLCSTPEVRIILLPRNGKQAGQIKTGRPDWFANGKTIIPNHAMDGLNLLWHSDLVISGGGTMNREAAALGVPVYSIFRGPIGAVDQYLSDMGKLILISNSAEIPTRLSIKKRDKTLGDVDPDHQTLQTIVAHIVKIAENSATS